MYTPDTQVFVGVTTVTAKGAFFLRRERPGWTENLSGLVFLQASGLRTLAIPLVALVGFG